MDGLFLVVTTRVVIKIIHKAALLNTTMVLKSHLSLEPRCLHTCIKCQLSDTPPLSPLVSYCNPPSFAMVMMMMMMVVVMVMVKEVMTTTRAAIRRLGKHGKDID